MYAQLAQNLIADQPPPFLYGTPVKHSINMFSLVHLLQLACFFSADALNCLNNGLLLTISYQSRNSAVIRSPCLHIQLLTAQIVSV